MTTRVGLIVPSSNVTMEIEVPRALRGGDGGDFSFHSSRMAMRQVSAEELKAMDQSAARCVSELSDARCDVLAYACLVAVMVQGPGAHREVEGRLSEAAAEVGRPVPIISSAGAVVDTLQHMGAANVAVVAPYVPELTERVVEYLAAEGITARSVRSLGVADNYDVGCIPPERVLDAAREVDLDGVDALVLSACVQMPSLDLVERVRDELQVPVLTASTATSAAILDALDVPVERQFPRPWRPL